MHSLDLEVLATSLRWWQAGHAIQLVTVVKTWGSSPRPEGAMLAIRDDGAIVGSVSGGCIEDDFIARVRCAERVQALPQCVTYGVTAEEARRFGLPWGVTIQLVIEPLTEHSSIDELLSALERGQLVARTLDMRTGKASASLPVRDAPLAFEGKTLRVVHGPQYRLLVIGAGDLSRFLCDIAKSLGYQVTVCDPREGYMLHWEIESVNTVRSMPDDAVLEMALDERCALIALTHDPKLDDLALMEALRTPAFYVGALGSIKNNAARRKRLRLFDVESDDLARLRGPAGLYIGSKTPPEIAISILAELTAYRNGVRVPRSATVEGGKRHRDVSMRRDVELGVLNRPENSNSGL